MVGGGGGGSSCGGGRRAACAVGRPEFRVSRAAVLLRGRRSGPGSVRLRDAQQRRGSWPEVRTAGPWRGRVRAAWRGRHLAPGALRGRAGARARTPGARQAGLGIPAFLPSPLSAPTSLALSLVFFSRVPDPQFRIPHPEVPSGSRALGDRVPRSPSSRALSPEPTMDMAPKSVAFGVPRNASRPRLDSTPCS